MRSKNPFPYINAKANESCDVCAASPEKRERKATFRPRWQKVNLLTHRRKPARTFVLPFRGALVRQY